jgi:hypothetical protein
MNIAKYLTNGKLSELKRFDLYEKEVTDTKLNKHQIYQLRYDNLQEIITCLKTHDILNWLQGKTMLGICKDKCLIEEDHDEDIGIFEEDIKKVCLSVVPKLINNGFTVIRATKNNSMLSLMKGPRYIDLCFFSTKGEQVGYENKWFPIDFYKEFIIININNFSYNISKMYKKICQYSYNIIIENDNSCFHNINILDVKIKNFIKLSDRQFMYKLLYPLIGNYIKHKENKNILHVGIDWHNIYDREFINNENIHFYGLDKYKKLNNIPTKWTDIIYLDLTIEKKTIEISKKFQVIIDYGVIGWGCVHNNLNFNQIKNYINNIKYLLNKYGIYCLKIDIKDSNKYTELLEYILSQFKVISFNNIENFDIYIDNKIKYKTFILSV